MPAHRTSNDSKLARGTFRGDRARSAVQVTALSKWPPAPKAFTEAERNAWKRLGRALLPMGTICSTDLILAERAAQIMACTDAAMLAGEDSLEVSRWLRLEASVLDRLGASPTSRERVQALPSETDDEKHDPTAEFGGR